MSQIMSENEVILDTRCAICIEDFTTTNVPFQIKLCQHIYHESCLNNYIQNCSVGGKAKCPLCKREFVKSTIVKAKELIHSIIKYNPKKKVKVQLLNGDIIEYIIDQSQTIAQLYKQLPIDEPFKKYNLEINDKTVQYLSDADQLIFDYTLQAQSQIIIQLNTMITVFLKLLQDNQNIILEVRRDMPIKEFYKLASQKTGIPEEMARYVVNGKNFDKASDQTLADYNIQNNSTIFQVARLKGGL